MRRRIVSRATASYARIRAVQFRSKRLRASAASFPLSGQAATLRISSDKILVAGSASYPLGGTAATLRQARSLVASPASYPLAGQDASFRLGKTLVADSTSYPLAGQDATLRQARSLVAGAASFPLAGQDATVRKGLRLVADAASYPLSGQTATLKRGLKVAANAASYPLTGQAATLTKSSSARTFTFVGSCVSNTSALNFGALSAGAVAADDLLVYIDYGYNNSSTIPTAVTPSGFTNGINTTFNASPPASRGMVSVKKATGSEASVTGINATNNKIGLVFRPSTAFTTINILDTGSEIIGNPAVQTCDPSAETTAVILLGVAATEGGTAAFSGASPAFDATVATADSDLISGYKLYNTSPASHSFDMSGVVNMGWLASLYLTVS